MDPSRGQGVQLLGELAQGTGHELSNLFGALLIRLQVLERKAGDGQPVASSDLEVLEDLIRGGIRVVRPLQQLGAAATTRRRDGVHVDLVAEIRSRYGQRGSVAEPSNGILLELPTEPISVAVEPSHLERILDNLVANARDSLPAEGGMVTIRVHRTLDRPSWITVEVADDGIGMDEATRLAATAPYSTTKMGAPGLGLTIVAMAVMASGGDLELRSTVGVGTIVRFTLPSAETRTA